MTKNVMVRGAKDPDHEDIKDIVSRWGLDHGYWFEQESRTYQELSIPHRPDVVLHAIRPHASRHSLVIVEIQRLITPQWFDKMTKQYDKQCLIIIPLETLNGSKMTHKELREHVRFQMECEVERHIPKKKKPLKRTIDPSGEEMVTCDRCGNPKKRKQLRNGICNPCKKELWRKEHE